MALKRLLGEESGQDLIEYALLAGLIALTAAAAVAALGVSVQGLFWDDISVAVGGS